MGAGAASTEAARAMVAMNEVYILMELGASVKDDQVHERTERLNGVRNERRCGNGDTDG